MRGQVFQKAELAHRGQHVAALHLHGHGGDVDLQVAESEHFGGSRRLAQSAEHAAHSGYELTRAERLGDVIVAAQLQAADAVGLGGLRSEKDDGRRCDNRSLPDVPAQLEAVGAGQHHVEKKERRHFPYRFSEHRSAADEALHLEARGLQIVGDQTGNVLIVFYYEDDGAERARTACALSPVVGFGWQVHSSVQAAPRSHDFQIEADALTTVLRVCCANVSRLLTHDEFVVVVEN